MPINFLVLGVGGVWGYFMGARIFLTLRDPPQRPRNILRTSQACCPYSCCPLIFHRGDSLGHGDVRLCCRDRVFWGGEGGGGGSADFILMKFKGQQE